MNKAIQQANRTLTKIAITLLFSAGVLFMSLLVALLELREVSLSKETKTNCIRIGVMMAVAASLYAIVRVTGQAYFANIGNIW